MKRLALLGVLVLGLVSAGCIQVPGPDTREDDDQDEEPVFVPHVVIGIPDTGINPYHELYRRPGLTAHPSTYIEDYPQDVPALELTFAGDDYDAMFEADKETWENVEEDQWYWIPGTVFIAVYCDSAQQAAQRGAYCILDDGNMHGTGTTSSALMENPDALIAFKAGGSSIEPFMEADIPVDIYSVSWGYVVPIPVDLGNDRAPIYVLAAGNDPRPTAADSWAGDPRNIVVGGAYAADDTQEILAAQHPDVVSYFCRPTADRNTTSDMRDPFCGTSFAAPTVAGALSKVILAVRTASGYTGGISGDHVDPLAGLTVAELREAMNLTATYEPEPRYNNTATILGHDTVGLPLNPVAPWTQWGWGFYDGLVADETIDHLTGVSVAAAKPEDAVLWMQTMRDLKETAHG